MKTIKTHELKTINPYFSDVYDGKKPVEIRLDDRVFEVEDILWLREYIPAYAYHDAEYTGREIICLVTYMIPAGQFEGLSPGYCLMVIKILDRRTVGTAP